MSPSHPSGAPARARLSARLALACALGAVVALVAASGPGGLFILVVGVVGAALAAVGTWWVLSHYGAVGVYAEVVQRPDYRDAQADSALDALPDLLLG